MRQFGSSCCLCTSNLGMIGPTRQSLTRLPSADVTWVLFNLVVSYDLIASSRVGNGACLLSSLAKPPGHHPGWDTSSQESIESETNSRFESHSAMARWMVLCVHICRNITLGIFMHPGNFTKEVRIVKAQKGHEQKHLQRLKTCRGATGYSLMVRECTHIAAGVLFEAMQPMVSLSAWLCQAIWKNRSPGWKSTSFRGGMWMISKNEGRLTRCGEGKERGRIYGDKRRGEWWIEWTDELGGGLARDEEERERRIKIKGPKKIDYDRPIGEVYSCPPSVAQRELIDICRVCDWISSVHSNLAFNPKIKLHRSLLSWSRGAFEHLIWFFGSMINAHFSSSDRSSVTHGCYLPRSVQATFR